MIRSEQVERISMYVETSTRDRYLNLLRREEIDRGSRVNMVSRDGEEGIVRSRVRRLH